MSERIGRYKQGIGRFQAEYDALGRQKRFLGPTWRGSRTFLYTPQIRAALATNHASPASVLGFRKNNANAVRHLKNLTAIARKHGLQHAENTFGLARNYITRASYSRNYPAHLKTEEAQAELMNAIMLYSLNHMKHVRRGASRVFPNMPNDIRNRLVRHMNMQSVNTMARLGRNAHTANRLHPRKKLRR